MGSIRIERLQPVIDAAIAGFEEFKWLRKELKEANIKLSQRKVIEQAKSLLMKQKNIDEDQAYVILCSMAMQKNMRIGTLSKQIVQAAELLL